MVGVGLQICPAGVFLLGNGRHELVSSAIICGIFGVQKHSTVCQPRTFRSLFIIFRFCLLCLPTTS